MHSEMRVSSKPLARRTLRVTVDRTLPWTSAGAFWEIIRSVELFLYLNRPPWGIH
jgi:hypothetical protein